MRLFKSKQSQQRAQRLQETAIRDLGGGLDTLDDDVNMSLRFQPVLRNFHRTANGAQEIRYGTVFRADVASVVTGNIVDMHYFKSRVVGVTSIGDVVTMKDDFTTQVVWNAAIAHALAGAPSGWSALSQVDFVPSKNELIIHNGIDKPITISQLFATTYLQDLGSGSNVNVPIGKYGCIAGNYHCVAGIAASPTLIYIASKGTTGTFPGDPIPNDAITFDVGQYLPKGAEEITGIAGFRGNLIVFFRGQALVVALGVYDGVTHIPQPSDVLPNFGSISHRTIVQIENDLIFGDSAGINSAKRNLFGNIESKHLSTLISPTYRGAMGAINQDVAQVSCFGVYDQLGGDVLIFEPNGSVFVYTQNEKLRYQAMSLFGDWNWRCGCTSALGRVFFAEGTRIYQLGNKAFNEQFYADKVGDYDRTWSTGALIVTGLKYIDPVSHVTYMALQDHVSGATFAADLAAHSNYWEEWLGVDIEFDLELPWLDGQSPLAEKQMAYVAVLSKGTAHFDLNLYVDNRYKDFDGAVIHDPELTLTMVGNDHRGAGYATEYGGARRSNSPRLWAFRARFKSAKYKITGSAHEPLTIIGLMFLFSKGKFKRGV